MGQLAHARAGRNPLTPFPICHLLQSGDQLRRGGAGFAVAMVADAQEIGAETGLDQRGGVQHEGGVVEQGHDG